MTDEEIDDVVDRWHKHEWRRLELWQALGWTRRAYRQWVEGTGDAPKGPWVPPEDRVCCLCDLDLHPITMVNVLDSRPGPPGEIVTLVCAYRDRPICERCWQSIDHVAARRQRAIPTEWDTWVELGKHFAHCPAKNITWELLPTGRPRKWPWPFQAPWKRTSTCATPFEDRWDNQESTSG